MKRVSELSVIELGNLDESEFEKYVKNEKMQEGIPLVKPNFPRKIPAPSIKQDTIIYEVAGLFLFKRSDAEAISAYLSGFDFVKTSSQYFNGSYYNLVSTTTKNPSFPVTGRSAYDSEKFDKWKEEISSNCDTEASFQEKENAYYKAIEPIQEIEEKLYGLYYEAKQKVDFMKETKSLFYEEYLPLSENNKDVAMKFLKKTYPDIDEEVENFILNFSFEPNNYNPVE